MTTALIAGQGALPCIIVDELSAAGEPFVVAALQGFEPELPGQPVEVFRIERLVPFLDRLADLGVTRVCLAGAVRRPKLEPEFFDPRTATLVPRLLAAMQPGDDATLRTVIAIFEEHGFAVVGAHELAPGLLAPAGVPTRATPPKDGAEANLGEATVADMGRTDTGQACVISGGVVLAREGEAGTDAMLAGLAPHAPRRGILFKAPKPTQDRRADLPVIGPGTARNAAAAGLAGIVIEAGGVMVLDLPGVIETLDDAGMFLWVRPPGGGA
ncbi:LpxI family protein [Albidovulum sediminicola]|uniref:UDP-2,3-diacylglucosamine diphosphatase LpxI n=1 Tax=Albidovulum sediminicola TaxID=2984331 RepID=A0ABT2YZS7_9RHOB|nr:UDP-2,3-diacylglucosamine diphosphatase LpxI [Defluviimonas sp. WL0075]MCV2864379.1 UDP-2,3-diacylglucosamine diphosphatase LpxI [Defluviimonas sp. WL0075]